MKKLAFLFVVASLLLFSCGNDSGQASNDAGSGIVSHVRSIAIAQYSIGQLVGKSIQLDVQFTPSNASNKNITWSVADPSVASVSTTGLFTALKPGKTTVTATSVDGAKIATAKASVWVPAANRTTQKFEPSDGRIYSGAGQSSADTAAMDNAMDPSRRPLIVNIYDGLFFDMAKISGYEIDTNAAYQTNMFPGCILEAGFALPPSQGGYLEKFGKGFYDKEIRKAAHFYGNMGLKVLMRIGWEFEANVYDPANYVQAFRRVVQVFREEGVKNVAYVWCCSSTAEYDDWYPGDSYVDWFAYDDLNSVGNDQSFQHIPQFFDWCGYASAHGKPVMIGEESTWDVPFDTWLPTMEHFWKELKASGIKAYQYINCNWPPLWGGHFNSQFTQNAEYTKAYNAEMANPMYIHRDPASYNPNALVVSPARQVITRNMTKKWEASDDLVVAHSGYSIRPKNVLSVTDESGRNVGWQNPTDSPNLDFDIAVPANSSGMLSLLWKLPDGKIDAGVDVYIGTRKALSSISKKGFHTSEVVCVFTPADSAAGVLSVSLRPSNASPASIRLGLVRIQTVSQAAPVTPREIRVRSGKNPRLNWDSVARASRYNVYRDGVLVGFAIDTNFNDTGAGKGSHIYCVSAWNQHEGEGFPAARRLDQM